ncbi:MULTISPECIES: hypothetical protein [Actinosynnema]|uniref:hypothetical protein n=1 Tax=Actinosynnema TaxID=40566 RepID=UPI0020A390D6|nr:hypothetical protein [Actinosynnema pretiosum]MCP2097463.1 hypothetical protein [Actinosynnema pretiosum]
MQEIRALAAPGIAADAAPAALVARPCRPRPPPPPLGDLVRAAAANWPDRPAAVATLIGIPLTPVLEREAREEAAGEAITVTVDGVFGSDTVEYTAMLLITVCIRNHGVDGAPALPSRAEFLVGQIHTSAEILETSGVDLPDQSHTVAQLRAYAHTLHPQGWDT